MRHPSIFILFIFAVAFYTFYYYKQHILRKQRQVSYQTISPSIDDLRDPVLRELYARNYPRDPDQRYNIEDSMRHTKHILDIHHELHAYTKEQLDTAETIHAVRYKIDEVNGRRDDALNAFIVSNPVPSQNDTNLLKRTLEAHIFEIYDIARKVYEDEPTGTYSYPVHYDPRAPLPVSNDTFQHDKIFIGTVEP